MDVLRSLALSLAVLFPAAAQKADTGIAEKYNSILKDFERTENDAEPYLQKLEALRDAHARDDASELMERRSEIRSALEVAFDQVEEFKDDVRYVREQMAFNTIMVIPPLSGSKLGRSGIDSSITGWMVYDQLMDRLLDCNTRISKALEGEEAAFVERASRLGKRRRKRKIQAASAAGILVVAAGLYAAWRIPARR